MVRICLQCRRSWFDPWVRKTPGEGNGNPLQYSWLENSMDRGAWWASVHEVAELYMTEWLTHTHTHTHTQAPDLDTGLPREEAVILLYTQVLFFSQEAVLFFSPLSPRAWLWCLTWICFRKLTMLCFFSLLSLSLLSRFLASTHPSHQPSGSDPVLRLWSLL